jgi:hypothetical protein
MGITNSRKARTDIELHYQHREWSSDQMPGHREYYPAELDAIHHIARIQCLIMSRPAIFETPWTCSSQG